MFWFDATQPIDYSEVVERIGKKSKSFREAGEWDIKQHRELSLEDRFRASANLKTRVYGENPPDVKACHRKGE